MKSSHDYSPYITGFYCMLVVSFLAFIPFKNTAQNIEGLQQQEPETDAEEVEMEEKIEIETKMSFDIFKMNNEVLLKTNVRQKSGKKFIPFSGQVVVFSSVDNAEIGRDTTNSKGVAQLTFSANENQFNSITYIAKIIPEKNVVDTIIETADLLPSFMQMELVLEDSIKTVQLTIGQPDANGNIIPIPDRECKIYVRRLFGDQPLHEEVLTSDEDGLISFELPYELKGDTAGNVILIAKISEDETIGNVEVSKTIDWAVPLSVNDFYSQRQLWSARSNAPLSLIIFVNSLLVLIWGAIFYVIYMVFKINRLSKEVV